MSKVLKISFLLLFIFLKVQSRVFPGIPGSYKTESKAVINGYILTVTTWYTPDIKYKKVAMLRNVYSGGILVGQSIYYETLPVISWKRRINYRYDPLIK